MLKRYHGEAEGASARFDVIPAIDLRGGRVVRLVEGDFDRETQYGDDPAGVAKAFAALGARLIHVVDLDGARQGTPVQLEAIGRLIGSVRGEVRCEVAGGLRTKDAVDAALQAGAARVVLGTRALSEAAFVSELVATYGGGRVVVALDVRAGKAVGEGWRDEAKGVAVDEALQRLADAGAQTFEVTAVDRDGRLDGPDRSLMQRLVRLERGAIVASGGIRSIDDLEAVRDLGCQGAIVGRALYEGKLDLAEAIGRFSGP